MIISDVRFVYRGSLQVFLRSTDLQTLIVLPKIVLSALSVAIPSHWAMTANIDRVIFK